MKSTTEVKKLKELLERRERLAKMNLREYQTMGNTQRCQELWAEIEEIDKQIAKRRCENV